MFGTSPGLIQLTYRPWIHDSRAPELQFGTARPAKLDDCDTENCIDCWRKTGEEGGVEAERERSSFFCRFRG